MDIDWIGLFVNSRKDAYFQSISSSVSFFANSNYYSLDPFRILAPDKGA
jgi:hypothetical protein